MAQSPSSTTTRYETANAPRASDGYPQRIEIWQAVDRLRSANRNELLAELIRVGHRRPNGAKVDLNYARIELTDMTKRGFLRRVQD